MGVINARWEEMDDPVNQLTLFLDPRYKEAADSRFRFNVLLKKVSNYRIWTTICKPSFFTLRSGMVHFVWARAAT